MSSPPKNSQDFVKHSKPIAIGTAHSRSRSASTSSSDSSGSPTSPSEPQTPLNTSPPRLIPPNISPSNSPILSYFMAQSPTKSATFPFNRKFPGRPPVFEGLSLFIALCPSNVTQPDHFSEDDTDTEVPVAAHARRASTTTTPGRFGQQQALPPMADSQHNRGAGVLRRLSLSNAIAKVSKVVIYRVMCCYLTCGPGNAAAKSNGPCAIPTSPCHAPQHGRQPY